MKLEPVTLRGRRLELRPLSRDDVPALCRVGLDPDIWATTTFVVRDEAEMAAYVEKALAWHAEGTCLPFVIVESGEVIGSSRFYLYDEANRKVEIGFTWFAPVYHGTGRNAESKLLMLTYAFETLGCVRVELRANEPNMRSRRAMEKIGAKFEGLARKAILSPDRGPVNFAIYSIIDDEWPTVKARLQELAK